MLYEAAPHEPLTASAWNEQAARACINEILDDAVDKFSAGDLWPSHPLDSFSPDARWNLYIGVAGTIWGLHHLSPKADSLPPSPPRPQPRTACPTSRLLCRSCWSPIAAGY